MSASDLEELYRDILLDHYRAPRNHGHVEGEPDAQADGANPLCGDELHIELVLDGDTIADVRFEGSGCSISQSSASMMTQHIRGLARAEALAAVAAFQEMMVSGEPPADDFGDMEALIGVAKFPVRVKCASLAWKTLEQAFATRGAAAQADTSEEPVAVTTDERSQGS